MKGKPYQCTFNIQAQVPLSKLFYQVESDRPLDYHAYFTIVESDIGCVYRFLKLHFPDHRKHRKLVSHYQTEGSTTLMCEEGGFLSHGPHTTLLVPRGALRCETEVTLSSHDHRQLQTMLASTGWDRTVRIACAVHVECDTAVVRFKQPVEIKTLSPRSSGEEEEAGEGRMSRRKRLNFSSSSSLSSLALPSPSSPSSPLLPLLFRLLLPAPPLAQQLPAQVG